MSFRNWLVLGFFVLIFLFVNFAVEFDLDVLREFVLGFGVFAPVVFILFYVFVTFFGFSAVFMTVFAGVLFGFWKGFFVVVVGATLVAVLAFYVGRRFEFGKDFLINKFVGGYVQRLEMSCLRRGFVVVSLLRLAFLPYVPLSYAAGMVRSLKFGDFFWATFLTNLLGSFVFIFLGFSFFESAFLFALALGVLFVMFYSKNFFVSDSYVLGEK